MLCNLDSFSFKILKIFYTGALTENILVKYDDFYNLDIIVKYEFIPEINKRI